MSFLVFPRTGKHAHTHTHAHAAGAMLTSEDLPETYRNVHYEDAEDDCTARFSEDPKKVLARTEGPRRFGPGHGKSPPK